MGNCNKNHCELGFETLENRILLAGDVSAVLRGSTLYITGDNAANDVAVTGDAEGNVTVQGVDGTSINRDSSGEPLTFSGVTNIIAVMNGGDDRLTIGGEDEEAEDALPSVTADEEEHEEDPGFKLAGWLTVDTGSGNDTVRMSFTEVAGNVKITTSGGNDAVDLGRGPGFGGEDHVEPAPVSTVVQSTVSGSEAPADEGGGPPSDVRIGGSLTISTGTGDDGVKVGFTDVAKDTLITTDGGNDQVVTGRGPINNVHGPGEGEETLSSLAEASGHAGGRPADSHFGGNFTVLTGTGDDMVVVRNSDIAKNARIWTDGGSDALALDNVGVMGSTNIFTGLGNDVLLVRGSDFVKAFSANTDGGNDSVFVGNNHFDNKSSLLTGVGNDAATVKGNDFVGKATISGGIGRDALDELDNTYASTPSITGFELDDTTFDFDPVNQAINDAFEGFMMGGPVG